MLVLISSKEANTSRIFMFNPTKLMVKCQFCNHLHSTVSALTIPGVLGTATGFDPSQLMVVMGELDPRIRALAIVAGACSEDDRDRGKPHGLPLLHHRA